MTVLSANILRCLSEADRKQFGKAGLLPEEVLQRAEALNERQLQGQIVNLLRLKGIEPLWHRTDKRSAATIGWPDLTFGVFGWNSRYNENHVHACAWEVKFGKGALSVEQEEMHVRLSTPPNCWRVRVIRSVDEALKELKEMGIE